MLNAENCRTYVSRAEREQWDFPTCFVATRSYVWLQTLLHVWNITCISSLGSFDINCYFRPFSKFTFLLWFPIYLFFFKSPRSCVLLHIPFTSVMCPTVALWRRKFILRIWPIQLALLHRILFRSVLLSPNTFNYLFISCFLRPYIFWRHNGHNFHRNELHSGTFCQFLHCFKQIFPHKILQISLLFCIVYLILFTIPSCVTSEVLVWL